MSCMHIAHKVLSSYEPVATVLKGVRGRETQFIYLDKKVKEFFDTLYDNISDEKKTLE